jgi:predicted ATP-grasp superfamily ATP-dependent carboligase
LNSVLTRLEHLVAGLQNRSYLLLETVLSGLNTHRLNILFSPHADWEPKLRAGFARTSHRIEFHAITAQDAGGYDLVVPLSIQETLHLAQMRELFQSNRVAIPTPQAVELCNHKVQLNQRLAAHGFARHIPPIGRALPRPYILKEVVGEWGANCHVIRTEADASANAELAQRDDYFCQAFVEGRREYATHMVYQDGRVLRWVNIEYVFDQTHPIKGQSPIRHTRVHDCPYLPLFAAMLTAIGFEGLCCINYKVLEGVPYLLEINPRFGGSLAPLFFAFMRSLGE